MLESLLSELEDIDELESLLSELEDIDELESLLSELSEESLESELIELELLLPDPLEPLEPVEPFDPSELLLELLEPLEPLEPPDPVLDPIEPKPLPLPPVANCFANSVAIQSIADSPVVKSDKGCLPSFFDSSILLVGF